MPKVAPSMRKIPCSTAKQLPLGSQEAVLISEEMLRCTFVLQYDSKCPCPYLVRLVGSAGYIDLKHHRSGETKDALGFGETLKIAFENAVLHQEKIWQKARSGHSKSTWRESRRRSSEGYNNYRELVECENRNDSEVHHDD